ncbi:hypothetical protein SLS56_009737 [Neofusicoccum ribis]|uniref:Acetoacetyl-CoA synthase n=1 Tax=Neofusicoccum ribis TaxID=45134 RepID=A0ABR3SGH3_9PEZI
MDRYRRHVNERFKLNLKDSHELHAWTIDKSHDFWIDVHSYLEIIPTLPRGITKAYDDTKRMRDIPPFFPGYKLNYTENILSNRPQNATALIGIREGESLDGYERLTWGQLSERVRETRSALLRSGIKKGDRVAAWMGNHTYTVVLFLAVGAIGAIFTSVSPDMGVEGTLSRFRQIQPSLLLVDSHSIYKGKKTPTEEKLKVVVDDLRSNPPSVFVNPVIKDTKSSFPILADFLSKADPNDALEYLRVPFNHPMVIVYSSGTSGPPKCIIHQQGNILQYKKIALLHNSLGPDSVVMQYTTTSWVMFYVMNGHMSSGAAAICYDGSPLYPKTSTILDILSLHNVTYWGTSPRHLHELQASATPPPPLPSLRLTTTTGAPLQASQYTWFHATFPPRVHLSSVAGGTDVQTSYLSTDPAARATHAGEMQLPALGMAIDVASASTGASVRASGGEGELVVRKPFASMPVGFWGDAGGARYRAAYFERFGPAADCWAQHDWVRVNPRTRGWVMTGRSDGVLNPSGVRFGSGEVYAVVEGERFHGRVADTLCVGRRGPGDGDEVVFLFVKMLPGEGFTEGLRNELREAVRVGLSSKHVPRFVVEVPDIPVTVNGKKVEIAVKQIISGKDVKISPMVANPEVLGYYRRFVQMERETPATKL